MPPDHPLDRPPGRGSAFRDDRTPVPVHPARALEFADNPGREYWWKQLDPNARTQLLNRVGDTVEW